MTAASLLSPPASTVARYNQFLQNVKILNMPKTPIISPVSLDDTVLDAGIASEIKMYSGNKVNKTYYENLFLMTVAQKLDPSTDAMNIIPITKEKKAMSRIFGTCIICRNGYILIPRCEIQWFKEFRMWSSSMKPDVVVFYKSDVAYLFEEETAQNFQSKGFNMLNVVKSGGIPLLYIEEESSTILQTALCCSFRVVEHHRLLRSIGIETTELIGFAFPRQTEPVVNVLSARAICVHGAEEKNDENSGADTCTLQQLKKQRLEKETAPIKVCVEWVSKDMMFHIKYEVLTKENMWSTLTAVANHAKDRMLKQNWPSFAVLKYSSFLFKLAQQELDHLKHIFTTRLQGESWCWLKEEFDIIQLPSAPSFVFQLKSKSKNTGNSKSMSCIVKYFVNKQSEFKFIMANMTLNMLSEADKVHFCMPDAVVRLLSSAYCFHVFEELLPPLTTNYAAPCIGSLCIEVHEALKVMHSNGLAHLDVRLPNICYRQSTSSDIIIPVLIDYERVDMAVDCSADKYVPSPLYPPNLENQYTDYVQLFLMAFQVRSSDKEKSKSFVAFFITEALSGSISDDLLKNHFQQFISLLGTDTSTVTDQVKNMNKIIPPD